MTQYHITRELLIELIGKFTQREIADQLGCAQSTVAYHLRKHNLTVRPYEPRYGPDAPKYTERFCRQHGVTRHRLDKSWDRRWYRCTQCSNDFSKRRSRNRKQILVEAKGGACQRCGYNRCLAALQFHHRDPDVKDSRILHNLASYTLERQLSEIDKCDLLCANCHFELHNETLQAPEALSG